MKSDRFQRFLRALLYALAALALGLAIGYLEMALIAYFRPGEGQESGIVPALVKAFEGGLLPLIKGGTNGFLAEAAKCAPAALCAIGVSFAWRAGLYQLGGAGQYALGVAACGACCTFFSWPWYVCALLSAAAGALAGWPAGWLKNRFRVHEGLSTAIIAWIGVYGAGALMQCFDPIKTEPSAPELPAAVLPAAIGALLWLFMGLTNGGWAQSTQGVSERIARYAGMNTRKTTALTLTAAAALAGLAGGLAWCLGLETGAPGIRTAVSGVGVQGLAAGMLAGGNPVGAALSAGLIGQLSAGAGNLDAAVFSPEVGEGIIAQILYLSAACMLLRGKKEKGGKSL